MKEEWKDIKGFKGIYQISNTGFVKSLRRKRGVCSGGERVVKESVLKNSLNNTGYHRVNLSNMRNNNYKLVHRLVCIAFIPNPKNKRTVNHKNGIKTDNHINNLEWATDAENIRHSREVLGNTYNKRRVIDTSTGEEFETLKDIVSKTKFSKPHLCAMMNGIYPNKTTFEYIESPDDEALIDKIEREQNEARDKAHD